MFGTVTAGRKRAAVELIAREEGELRKTAARYSLCAEDAEDAYQRGLEILLTKAPSERPRELIRWTKTVVKHEALAIRRGRERLLGTAGDSQPEDGRSDDVARIPAAGDGPAERLQRRERLARSREALRALKPAELRSLTLLAAGYSYAEIAEITGFSQTKINRTLAEGRERFRLLVSRSEDGSRCEEMRPLLSAFCDGEARPEQESTVREHLRACAACRAAMRAYRSTPATVAALAPALPAALPGSRSLLERAQELLVGVQARLPGAGGAADAGMAQAAAAGGGKGVGVAAMAKLLALCAGTASGAAACVAAGVTPAPLGLGPERADGGEPRIERVARRGDERASAASVDYEPASEPPAPPDRPKPSRPPQPEARPEPAPAPVPEPPPTEAGAVEYAPPPPEPAPAEPDSAPAPEADSGSAAGEFGP